MNTTSASSEEGRNLLQAANDLTKNRARDDKERL